MWRKFKGLFSRKPTLSAEEAFIVALENLNNAWQVYDAEQGVKQRVRPWIDWPNKRMILSISTYSQVDPRTRKEVN